MTITHGSTEYKKALEEARLQLSTVFDSTHLGAIGLLADALLAAEDKVREMESKYEHEYGVASDLSIEVNQLRSELAAKDAQIARMVEVLGDVAKGHTISRMEMTEDGLPIVRDGILVTPETERARDLLKEIGDI